MKVTVMRPYSAPRTALPAGNSAASMPPKPSLDIKAFKTDDWILLSIIAFLFFEGCTDYLLLCVLGYLFIMGL